MVQHILSGIPRPLCLIIMDGWGISNSSDSQAEGNATVIGKTPNMDYFYRTYPNTVLLSSGEAVGLPEGQMGNSEVGHLNIGAGRVVYQELTRITKSIRDGDFFNNQALISAVRNVSDKNSCLHIMGLVSDGGVHSHINHLKALIDLAEKNKIKKVYIHAFLDGRDVPPRSAIPYLKDLDDYLFKKASGEIATVSGRYYAMDRDNRWDRVKKAYDAMVYRDGRIFESAESLVEDSYNNGLDDEFVIPALVKTKDEKYSGIKSGDSIIFFNFRPDRARQLTKSFITKDFADFDRGKNPPQVFFVCMTQYSRDFDAPVAFPPAPINNTLGQILSANNLRQLRIAETEKYAHVTFFFNGGVEKPDPGEDRILIPSLKIATYNLKPEMSAVAVTDTVIEKIEKNIYDVIILNYANPDMVGHTGYIEAAVKAVETVDACIGKVINKLNVAGGLGIITADHGNVEEMINCDEKCPMTAHTGSMVPFIICTSKIKKLRGPAPIRDLRQQKCPAYNGAISIGALCDIAPTILEILNIKKPEEMTGISLITE
nr:MAG: 2,3-bisphosphoglycerate-independent phosphoglycerate mutase [Actinobacteria bacterium ADurb.Bin346]